MPNGREFRIHTEFVEERRVIRLGVDEVVVEERGVRLHLPVVQQVEVGVVGELWHVVVFLHWLMARRVLGGEVRA